MITITNKAKKIHKLWTIIMGNIEIRYEYIYTFSFNYFTNRKNDWDLRYRGWIKIYNKKTWYGLYKGVYKKKII